MTGEYDSGGTRPRNCGVKGAEKCSSRFFVQTVGGLVQKKNHRMPEQGPHQQEQAELALRQRGGVSAQQCRSAEFPGQGACRLAILGGGVSIEHIAVMQPGKHNLLT